MKHHEVHFTYFGGNESASDTFRFSSAQEAQEKFCELRDVIEHNFAQCARPEVIDEPDFFGIRDLEDGSFARVILD